MTGVRPGTTVEEIYLVLRERIIEGVYGPGMRMSQSGLAAELNISRTPLREALQRLEGDGLLVAEANRGMQVAPADIGQIEQYYTIRLLVEPPTIAAIVGELTGSELSKMAAELDAMEADHARIRDFQEAHARFHEYGITHYPAAVAELTHALHLKIYRHQRLYFSRPQVSEDFTSVDRKFLAAIQAGDGEAARQLLEFHLVDAALGMITEGDPDYRYHSLLVATRGAGIALEHNVHGRVPRPASITWQHDRTATIGHLRTANLVHDGGRDRSPGAPR